MKRAQPTDAWQVKDNYRALNSFDEGGTTLSDSRICVYPAPDEYNSAVLKLNDLRALSAGWDGYCAASPSEASLQLARRIISIAIGQHGLIPSLVLPSAEGGVGIGFRAGVRYADIECFNSGEAIALTSEGNGSEPRVWEIDVSSADLTIALEAIGEHLGKFVSAGAYSQWSAT